jgi:cytochrome c biogenesis protein CcmG/thiol:disulfide interchange protein DsbE
VSESAHPDRGGLRHHLLRGIALLAVLMFLALLVYGLTTQGSSGRVDESLAKGEAPLAPEFNLPVLDPGALPAELERRLREPLAGGQLGLSDLSRTPFVLNFWASWCPPCREEAPILEAGWQRHQRQGVLYLGLNMQDLTGDARAFLDEFGLTYPQIREPEDTVAKSYGATGLPETYFVSGEGRIVAHVVGAVSPEQLDEGVTAARRGRVLGTLTGGAIRPQR